MLFDPEINPTIVWRGHILSVLGCKTVSVFCLLCFPQNRAKGQSRRPPSRRALRQSGSQSSDTAPSSTDLFSDRSSSSEVFVPQPFTSKAVPVADKKGVSYPPKKTGALLGDNLFATESPKQATKALTDQLEREIAQETGIFNSRRGQDKLRVDFGEALFEQGGVDATDDGELFPSVPVKPKQRPPPSDDLFSIGSRPVDAVPVKPTTAAPSKTADIFEAPPEDIFTSKAPPPVEDVDLFAPAQEESKPGKSLDDLFAEVSCARVSVGNL